MNEKFCWPARPPLECKRACTPSAGHIYDFHIFTVIYSSLRGLIWNQHNDQLPVGLLANLIGYCSGIAEVMGSNPVQAWLVFQALIHYCSNRVHYCEDRFQIHVFIRSSHIWFSYIHSHLRSLLFLISRMSMFEITKTITILQVAEFLTLPYLNFSVVDNIHFPSWWEKDQQRLQVIKNSVCN